MQGSIFIENLVLGKICTRNKKRQISLFVGVQVLECGSRGTM